MASDLSATEIIDVAKQIEAAGEAFYAEALEHLKDPGIREVFTWLREEEKRHARVFEALLARLVDSLQGDWRHDEQYLGYLRALAGSRVFPGPAEAQAAVRRLETDADAVRLAMGFEKDTILFFHEVRTMVREDDHEAVDRLVAEEQSHLRALGALLEKRGEAAATA